jgi:hypothetical protein
MAVDTSTMSFEALRDNANLPLEELLLSTTMAGDTSTIANGSFEEIDLVLMVSMLIRITMPDDTSTISISTVRLDRHSSML